MSHHKTMKRWSAVGLAAISCLALVHGAAQAPGDVRTLPNSVWDRTFRSDDFEYQMSSMAAAADSLWLSVTVRPKGGARGGSDKIELWRINQQGERVQVVALSTLRAPQKPLEVYSRFYGMTAFPNGEAAVALSGDAGLGYVVVDPAGKVRLNRAVAPQPSEYFIAHLTAVGESALAVGRAGAEGWLLKLGATGVVLADFKVRDVTVLLDAIEMPAGFVALGGSVDATGSTAWVGRINSNGEVTAQTRVVGINPSLARGPRGVGFILAYETNVSSGRRIMVQGLTDALTPAWTAGPPEVVSGLRPYGVEPIGDSDVLLVGESPARALWIRRMNRNSGSVWTYEHHESNASSSRLWNSAVTRWGADDVVGATLSVVQPNKDRVPEQRQVVKLLRFHAE